MKKKILILSCLFIFLLVFFTPAKLLNGFLPDRSPLVIDGIDGSVWSGEINQVSMKNINLKDIEFSVSLLSLLMFSPSVDMDVGRGDAVGDFTFYVTPNPQQSLHVSNANLVLDSAILQDALPLPGLELQGDVTTSDLELKTENRKPQLLQGEVQWKNASVVFAGQAFQLGDLGVSVTTDEETKNIVAQILKTKNVLDLQGNVTLSANGMVEFTGSIATNIDQTLYNAFALFNNGKPENGRLPIKFKQRLLR